MRKNHGKKMRKNVKKCEKWEKMQNNVKKTFENPVGKVEL
jgi:hypothetical protein